ncbi:MAG TPA: hypothetical protein VFO67_07105 [Gemmatimonadales bacterium]|nr:hypothetical protein [Gemmatimonadales bacterium]
MRLRHTVTAIVISLTLGCGIADLFDSQPIGDLVVTYNGPTVLSVGDTAAISVSVTAGGALMPDARVSITSANPTILALSAASDTIVALDRGWDTLTIRVVASIFTDTLPTVLQPIRVTP